MHTTPFRPALRRLLGALPLALLLLSVACDGAAPRTIGGYCRRDLDCVSGLRCLGLVCTERRVADGGTAPVDQGHTVDGGPVDSGAPDLGRDLGPADTGVDSGPADVDAGVDAGPADAGPQDSGVDAGPVDGGPDTGL